MSFFDTPAPAGAGATDTGTSNTGTSGEAAPAETTGGLSSDSGTANAAASAAGQDAGLSAAGDVQTSETGAGTGDAGDESAQTDSEAGTGDGDQATQAQAAFTPEQLAAIGPLLQPLLQEYGGVEGLQKAIAENDAAEVRQAETERVQQRNSQILDGVDKDIEAGNVSEAQRLDAFQYRVAMAELHETRINTALGEAKTAYKHMDETLVRRFGESPEMVHAIAKHTHEIVAKLEAKHAKELAAAKTAAKSELAATLDDRKKVPTPQKPGGGAPVARPADPNKLPGWSALFSRK